jgi:hypothetical protein
MASGQEMAGWADHKPEKAQKKECRLPWKGGISFYPGKPGEVGIRLEG